jgi:hypothetical protein
MTALRKLEVMIFWGLCYLCGLRLTSLADTEFDHEQPLDTGGQDDPTNIRPVHAVCHRNKTKADVRKIAKARRLRKSESEHQDAVMSREPGTKRAAKGKIPSRPFQRPPTKAARALRSGPFSTNR